MKILNVQRQPVNFEEFIKRSAVPSDCSRFINESCIIKENGEIKIIYKELDTPCKDVVEAVKSMKYSTGQRSRGLTSTSRIIGYRPRLTIRADYCSSTSTAKEYPDQHARICDYIENIEKEYKELNPELYEKHKEIVEGKTQKEWRIKGGIFTSGIINKDSALKYHFDTGNFTDVWSAMTVFKSGIEGGYLCVPEYDMCFELKDNSIFLFDGQGLLHGVTPIKKSSPLSYRFSIVFYSLKQIWKCLPITDELARVKKMKTKREVTRHNMPAEHRADLIRRFGKQ